MRDETQPPGTWPLFRRALRRAIPGTAAAAIVTAAVFAPAFTGDGWVITVLLIVSLYPLFLVGYYIFLGWRVAAQLAGVLAPTPRRAPLIVGSSVALALTLILVTTLLVLDTALIGIVSRSPSANGIASADNTSVGIQGIVVISTIYIAGMIAIGFPCAWLGAWLRLRQRPVSQQETLG